MAAVAVWSTGAAAAVAAGDPLVSVGGVALAPWELERELAQSIAGGTFHRRVPGERMAELECESLQRLVLKELKRQWAQRNGVEVDPAVVAASWKEVRDRFDSDDQYRSALAMKGISDADFRRGFERDAAAVAVDSAVLADVEPPSEQEVEVYFSLHSDRYMSPEARHVVHALVHVPPSADAEAWRRAEAEALKLASEAAEAESGLFDVAMALREQLPPSLHDQVGDLGFVHRGSLLPAIDDAVFGAEPGSIAGPVRSIYGFHLLEVVDTRPPRPLELADVRDAVSAFLTTEKRQRRLEAFERELRQGSVVEGNGCAGAL